MPTLQLKAYPNPYTNQVNFKFTSPVSGKAILTAYDLLGRKMAIIFQGQVNAGIEQVVTYDVPVGNRVTMMYKLTVGDKSYHGMLIPLK
jgi:hypothetical protein